VLSSIVHGHPPGMLQLGEIKMNFIAKIVPRMSWDMGSLVSRMLFSPRKLRTIPPENPVMRTIAIEDAAAAKEREQNRTPAPFDAAAFSADLQSLVDAANRCAADANIEIEPS
jgi:hypothetical protein